MKSDERKRKRRQDESDEEEGSVSPTPHKSEKTSHEETTNSNVNNTIQVRNMSFDTTEDSLRSALEEYGTIVKIDIPEFPRGVAFVQFKSVDSAEKAVSDLNEQELDGRKVYVSITGKQQPTVFVGNLSFDTTEDTLRDTFDDCGKIVDIRIPTYQDSGKPRGFAFVVFDDKKSLQKAVELDGTTVDGRSISVNESNGDQGSGRRRGGGGFRGGRGGGGGFRGGRGGFGGGRGGRGGFNGGGRGGGGGFRGGRGGFRGGNGGGSGGYRDRGNY